MFRPPITLAFSPSARARPGGDSGEAVRATRGDGGAVSWHGSARAISLLFPLHLHPICNCSSLIFLKITCSCLARERTAVSVRFIRIPIALELRPVSANFRSLSSSVCVHGREAKCSGSVIGPRAPRLKQTKFSKSVAAGGGVIGFRLVDRAKVVVNQMNGADRKHDRHRDS